MILFRICNGKRESSFSLCALPQANLLRFF